MRLLTIACSNCGRVYPLDGTPHACIHCGGVYDLPAPLRFRPEEVDASQPGIWRYRALFGLPPGTPPLSLGEGNTPLLADALPDGRPVYFKAEYLNPTGSFKDRGAAVLTAFLRARGAQALLEDSSGNAGASLAAYAARAGLPATVYVPQATSEGKRAQIEAYGARLVAVPGPRSAAAEAARQAAETGRAVYASHAWLPLHLPGYATIALEIYEQLGQMPGAVVVPVGQGGLLLGLYRGFDALRQAGLTLALPRLIGVQALACAPLWTMATMGVSAMGFVQELPTLAEGIRVRHPLRGDAVLRAVENSRGQFVAVPEEEILPARDELARRGLYVEPTSAVVWAALRQLPPDLPHPLVLVLTGSGYKVQESGGKRSWKKS